MNDYKQVLENPPEGISASPISEDNLFIWGLFCKCCIYLVFVLYRCIISRTHRNPMGRRIISSTFAISLKLSRKATNNKISV
jgi:bacteriorhodopsin